MENLVEEIQHLQVKPGDVVFFKLKEGTMEVEALRLGQYIREQAGEHLKGVTVLFGHGQTMIEVIESMPEEAMNEIGWYRPHPDRN